jgi:tetratricopeptide (TPR) repeat protein
MCKNNSDFTTKTLAMKSIGSVLSVIFILFSGLLAAQDLNKAKWLIQEEQFLTAKTYMLGMQKTYPQDAKVKYFLGLAYLKNDQPDSAEIAFRQGISLNPNEPLNYAGLGGIELNKKNQEESFRNFEKVRKLSSKSIFPLLEVVNACMSGENKDIINADRFLALATNINPKDPMLHLVTGNYFLQLRKTGDAANAFERALYYDPDCYIAKVKIGKIYTDAKNYNLAVKALTDAVKIDSTGILVYKYLGDLYYIYGQYSKAKWSYEKYLEQGEINPFIEERYSFILFFNKDFEEAEKSLDKLIAGNQNDPVHLRLKAYIDYETGKYDTGLQFMEKFFSVQDTGKILVTDYIYYGRLLIKNQQDSLGLTHLIKATEMDTTKTDTYEEIAKQFSKMKKHEPAVYWYSRLLKTNPESVENVHYQIGREFYMWAEDTTIMMDSIARVGLYNKADSSFCKLIELKPDSYLGYLFRARTRTRLDPETITGYAKSDYEKTLSILEPGDKVKNKKYLMECYRYLAFYYYMLNEKGIQQTDPNTPTNIENSLYYWRKILEIEPQDVQALTAIDNLEKTK